MFENRTYRRLHQKKGLVSFNVTVKETNLNIQADKHLARESVKAVLEIRHILETYIGQHPGFAASLAPVKDPGPSPGVIRDMIKAARAADVGPMAAVAGMVAEYTGSALLQQSNEVVVENGGDIFVRSDSAVTFSIYAGDSPFSMTTGIRIKQRQGPFGLCTSSGTLGHSKSFGRADAACVLSPSCPLADAAATALGNRVSREADIQGAIDFGKTIPGVEGIVIIKKEHIGAWGKIELVRI